MFLCALITNKRINSILNHITPPNLLKEIISEAKNNNINDIFKHLKELLNNKNIDKIKNNNVRKKIEQNACQTLTKPYIVYKKIAHKHSNNAFIATLLLPIGTTIVRPFEEIWINKGDGYMDLYMDVPFLDVYCKLSKNMRVDSAIVINIEAVNKNIKVPNEGFISVQDNKFEYKLWNIVRTELDTNPRRETTNGIHVVATKEAAIGYIFL